MHSCSLNRRRPGKRALKQGFKSTSLRVKRSAHLLEVQRLHNLCRRWLITSFSWGSSFSFKFSLSSENLCARPNPQASTFPCIQNCLCGSGSDDRNTAAESVYGGRFKEKKPARVYLSTTLGSIIQRVEAQGRWGGAWCLKEMEWVIISSLGGRMA